jgi:hypothetical protein
MSSLSLREAYQRALQQAPGISEEDFLEQTRLHLLAGRLTASAYSCEQVGHWEESPRCLTFSLAALDHKRRDIPAVEWAELKLYLETELADMWGHERSPAWTRGGGPYEDAWSGDNGEGAPVYSEIRLLADSFDKLWILSDVDGAKDGLNARKRKAVLAAFEKLGGVETLLNMTPRFFA